MSEIRSQATPARDELAGTIHAEICEESLEDCLDPDWRGKCARAADVLLASSWSKPRTVNSTAEFEALPVGSVVRELDDAPSVFEKVAYEEGETGWEMPGDLHWYTPGEIALPATILFTPGDAG